MYRNTTRSFASLAESYSRTKSTGLLFSDFAIICVNYYV